MDRRELLLTAPVLAGGTVAGAKSANAKRGRKIPVRISVSLAKGQWSTWQTKVKEGATLLSALRLIEARYRLNMGIVVADPAEMPYYRPRNAQTGELLDGIGLAGMAGQMGYSFRPLFNAPDVADYREFWLFRTSTRKVNYRGRLVNMSAQETINQRFLSQYDYNSGELRPEPADITDKVTLGPPYIPAQLQNDQRMVERVNDLTLATYYSLVLCLPNEITDR